MAESLWIAADFDQRKQPLNGEVSRSDGARAPQNRQRVVACLLPFRCATRLTATEKRRVVS